MNIRPLYDRVVVRRSKPQEMTASGLYIPEKAQDKPLEGEVVAVGKGVYNENGTLVPLDCKVGDKVLFGHRVGTELKVNGEPLLVLREMDIFGILE